MNTGTSPTHFPVGLEYEAIDPVMVRSPLLSIDERNEYDGGPTSLLTDTLDHERAQLEPDNCRHRSALPEPSIVRVFMERPILKEAVMVASADLYNSLSRLAAGDALAERKRHRTEDALARYLVRMATRPTPFGLFAGVALCNIAQDMAIKLRGPEQNNRRARPDMGWMLRLVRSLEQQQEIARHLTYFVNPLCSIIGNRLYLPYTDTYGQDDIQVSGSFKTTSLLFRVLALAQHGIVREKLVAKIREEWPQASEDQVTETVQSLQDHGVLLSQLRPHLTGGDAFKFLLRELYETPSSETFTQPLETIATHLSQYNEQPIGNGICNHGATLRSMSKAAPISDIKAPLQIDMATAMQSASFGREVAEEAAYASELLVRLATGGRTFPHLDAYRGAFLEKFGTAREVSLLELLDPRVGLGPPATYQHPAPRRTWESTPPQFAARDRILLALAVGAIRERRREVEVDEYMIERLQVHSDWRAYLPNSVELYVSVGAVSQEAINRGDFQIVVSPAGGNQPAGPSFGRFYDILGKQAKGLLQRIAKEEERQFPQRLFAELVYLPQHASSGNVTTRPAIRQYEIAVGASASVNQSDIIPLADLAVSLRHGLFCVRSISRDAEVVIRYSHRFNYHLASNVFRFLSELSSEGVLRPQPFDWGAATRLDFLPRLRVGRVVLCPARWLLSSEFECLWNGRGLEWAEAVRRWAQTWEVPRYVYLTEFDNRLLLDLRNPRDLLYLERQYRQRVSHGQVLELQEMLPTLNQAWATDESHRHYLLEFVIPMRRRRSGAEQTSGPQSGQTAVAPRRQACEVQCLTRIRPPGTEWLFAKLYCAEDVHNDVIVDYLPALIDEFVGHELIDCWFFVRYADPVPHLRLRFFGEPKTLRECVLPRLSTWSAMLIANRISQRLALDTYDREIERYGGAAALPLVESIFAADSVAAMHILSLQRKGMDLTRSDLALLSVDALLASLGLNDTGRLSAYATIVAEHEDVSQGQLDHMRKTFFGHRKVAQRIVTDGEWIYKQPGGKALASVLHSRSGQIGVSGNKIRDMETRGELSVAFMSIVESLIHMHMNRMFGMDRQFEHETVYNLMRTHQSLERLRTVVPHVYRTTAGGGM